MKYLLEYINNSSSGVDLINIHMQRVKDRICLIFYTLPLVPPYRGVSWSGEMFSSKASCHCSFIVPYISTLERRSAEEKILSALKKSEKYPGARDKRRSKNYQYCFVQTFKKLYHRSRSRVQEYFITVNNIPAFEFSNIVIPFVISQYISQEVNSYFK